MTTDKKIVNTEEENRAVNPGDSPTQEDSISQEAAHTVNTNTSETQRTEENDRDASAVNPVGDNELKEGHVEGDELKLDKPDSAQE